MINLNIHINGDNCWPDLLEKSKQGLIIHHTGSIDVAALAGGMQSGKPSVAIRIDLPDGRTVIAETSLSLFIAAARAFYARYGGML